MQYIIKSFARILILFLPCFANSQSTYLPQGHKHQQLLERLEILLQKNPDLNVATTKPLSRRIAVRIGEYADSVQNVSGSLLSKVDQHNLQSLFMNSSEWVTGDKTEFASKKSLWNTFYKTKAHLLEVDENDFFLAINPVIQQQQSLESDNDERVFLNTKGATLRGMIARKIGFSAYLTDNQERGPRFVQDRVDSTQAVPGAGYYKPFKTTATDYFDARGSINFTVAKYVDIQFGYDKNFIGNGYRSLFLSDYGNSYMFLKLNTRIWKINYQNLFMELHSQFAKDGADNLLDKKYAAMHHLSINATKWLNIGLFEGVIFGRENHFEFSYLNPVIFLRSAERSNGSADNGIAGLDFKANIAKKLQLYGQWMLDEFFLKEVKAGDGWWGNKFGVQLGGKYIDVFKIRNLDIQGELNWVRPFSYSHYDSVSNYTHYNQPLAHPLGANFMEAIGIIRYQPHPKWTSSARLIVWRQGLDTAAINFGGNIFKLNSTRSADYGYTIPSGVPATGINAQLLISYEAKENIFLDVSLLVRRLNSTELPSVDRNTVVFTAGLRMNMFRREYDY
ncbi:MAG: hypothetical protein ACXWCG_08365 [Flavitalea sp.]